MKVCLVHEEYPEETNFGGIATYQKNIAEELVKMGHKVYVICRGLYKNEKYTENGVEVTRIYIKNSDNQLDNYVNYRLQVAKILSEFQKKNMIDIIETPDWGAETIFFESERKIPLVVRLHTPLKVWLKYNKNNFGPVKKYLLKWEEHMINSADLVTCCSKVLKRMIVKEFKIKSSRIKVTPNPANLSNFYLDSNIEKKNELLYVGSIEQRKGVCTLAKALNYVFDKYPNVKVKFIGKDTNRNVMNISTIELIYQIINEKFHKNIEFLGQIPNYELNQYLNETLVAIYPSLFDNFPYVVLEAMATGVHIIGSKNSGMVEMLKDDNSIFKTGNSRNLASKICEKYEIAKKNPISYKNIHRVNKYYNKKRICGNLIKLYEITCLKYNENRKIKNELQIILNRIAKSEIISVEQENAGLANNVYKVKTINGVYIIKKYNYRYNFEISNLLYNVYENNGICVIRPINSKIINYKFHQYNIFKYVKDNKYKQINEDYFLKLICCDRKVDIDDMLIAKCNKYYNVLKSSKDYNGINSRDIKYVLVTYENIDKNTNNWNYLNHGDIQRSNIIKSHKNYLIDFDEVIVSSYLYDFAVIMVKMFSKNMHVNYDKFNLYREAIKMKNKSLKNIDFYNIIILYLCKILLEKYYLHVSGSIDLYSKSQLKDNYSKYLLLLKDLCVNKVKYNE